MSNRITKAAIQSIATPAIAAKWLSEVDKDLYLEGVIDAAGFDISLTNRPAQRERTVDWLADALDLNTNNQPTK